VFHVLFFLGFFEQFVVLELQLLELFLSLLQFLFSLLKLLFDP
jgi:hypothetical protein